MCTMNYCYLELLSSLHAKSGLLEQEVNKPDTTDSNALNNQTPVLFFLILYLTEKSSH